LGLKPLPRNASKSQTDEFGQKYKTYEAKELELALNVFFLASSLPFVPIQANTSIKVTSSTYLLMFIIILRCKIMIEEVCTYFVVSYKFHKA